MSSIARLYRMRQRRIYLPVHESSQTPPPGLGSHPWARYAAPMSAMERYHQLTAKVDAFFESVYRRHQSSMQCGRGCSACCHVRLSVSSIEAAAIADAIAEMPPRARDELAAGARAAPDHICAALTPDGACRIYASRPLVCRSQGVPIRLPRAPGHLPVVDEEDTVVEVCELNFAAGAELAQIESDAVLDQNTMSTILAALDMAWSQERALQEESDNPPPTASQRVELAALLKQERP